MKIKNVALSLTVAASVLFSSASLAGALSFLSKKLELQARMKGQKFSGEMVEKAGPTTVALARLTGSANSSEAEIKAAIKNIDPKSLDDFEKEAQKQLVEDFKLEKVNKKSMRRIVNNIIILGNSKASSAIQAKQCSSCDGLTLKETHTKTIKSFKVKSAASEIPQDKDGLVKYIMDLDKELGLKGSFDLAGEQIKKGTGKEIGELYAVALSMTLFKSGDKAHKQFFKKMLVIGSNGVPADENFFNPQVFNTLHKVMLEIYSTSPKEGVTHKQLLKGWNSLAADTIKNFKEAKKIGQDITMEDAFEKALSKKAGKEGQDDVDYIMNNCRYIFK